MMLSLPVNHYMSETHPICEILLTLPDFVLYYNDMAVFKV